MSRRKTTKKPKVFVSFHNKDRHAKELLVAQAKNKNTNLEFSNQSVDKPFKAKWKTKAEDKIQKASATVVMVGKDTHKRKAVQWEIEKSREAGNKIIAVQIHKDKHHRLPSGIKKSEEIRWNTSTLSRRLKKGGNINTSASGKCKRCGRTLTNPTSVSLGLGPYCRTKI